jgi:hypothetical protein
MSVMDRFKKRGGFLNGVDGVLTGYEWTTEAPGGGGGAKKKKGSDFISLFCRISVRVDGADEDIQTSLFAGDGSAFEIEDDGALLSPLSDDSALFEGTNWYRLLASAIEHGFPESAIDPEVATNGNMKAMVGGRYTFTQMVDEAAKAKGLVRTAKNGKTYPYQYTAISAVLSLPGKAGKGVSAKDASKPAGKASPKGKAAPQSDDDEDLKGMAQDALVKVLKAAGGSIEVKKLGLKVPQAIGLKHPQRDAILALVSDAEFLGEFEAVTYNAKKGLVTLVVDDTNEENEDTE